MKAYLSGWESLCASSSALRFIDTNLRGIGQVMFQDNPLSGALFLAAIVWGSIAAGMPQVAICGALAVVVATLTAQVLRVDESTLRAGLYGFNGVLVGLALATFIAPGPLLWLYVVLGAAVSVVTMSATANALKALGMPTLTFPFVLVTWLLLLATYGFAGLGGDALPAADVIAPYEPFSSCAARVWGFPAGDPVQHFAGLPQGECRRGPALSRRTCRQFRCGGGRGRRRRDPRGRHRAPARRRKRPDHGRPAGLQPGADGGRVGHGLSRARLARRGLCRPRHGLHRHCPGGVQRGADANRHPGPDCAVCTGDLAFPAAAAAIRPRRADAG